MKINDKTLLLSKKSEWLVISIFWLIYTFFDYTGNGLIRSVQGKTFFHLPDLFTITMYFVQIFTIFIIYTVVAPKFLKKINWKTIAISLILSFATFIFIRYVIEQVLTDILFDKINYFEGTPLSFYIYDNLHYGTFIVFSSLFIWMAVHLIKTLQKTNSIEKEKKEAEIKFLKAQINPHFLFNTLNNIYSLVSINSDQSLKAIENLSAIMRFTTYETHKESIEIEQEINYIKQYLALEQIRFGEKFFVKTAFDIKNYNTLIPPYILSPLIENAIKHGIVRDSENPIVIDLSTTEDFLEISVKNKINQHQKDQEKGIGLMNLKQRLNHYFENQYQFEIQNDYITFTIYLKFPLNAEN
jgi:sensor histidine kinase YesM